jgi:hypothetical protein
VIFTLLEQSGERWHCSYPIPTTSTDIPWTNLHQQPTEYCIQYCIKFVHSSPSSGTTRLDIAWWAKLFFPIFSVLSHWKRILALNLVNTLNSKIHFPYSPFYEPKCDKPPTIQVQHGHLPSKDPLGWVDHGKPSLKLMLNKNTGK